ncbi:MAG: sulfotransferase, partial [Gammaproteobacteria bacterium]|nr:sulfotransferase [Gammaproteobacteria bacterium]
KGHESEAPVFIVGMPRSGTSLVEQIIASHPQAYGAGELTYIGAVINNLAPDSDDYPECMKHVSPSILEGIADGYIRHISTLAGNEKIVVDKMPLNYHHLGFIRILFPKAKIIHCKRNPMDTCLSCYMMDFAARQPFSNNLDDLGEYYKLYLKQMQYWKDVVKIPILDIQYEELVDNQEEISHKIISYCGLDWDDACLSFHKNKRVTLTASNQQVNKPIYKKSVERWRNYEEDLTPLIKTLGTSG